MRSAVRFQALPPMSGRRRKPMTLYGIGEFEPTIAPSAFVHPDAVVIGDVTIGEHSSVWPTAVLRGDNGPIVVGARTSVQDGTIVHTIPWSPTWIGDEVTIGHNAHLEGCRVEHRALVGSGSIVLHRAVVGEAALVGAARWWATTRRSQRAHVRWACRRSSPRAWPPSTSGRRGWPSMSRRPGGIWSRSGWLIPVAGSDRVGIEPRGVARSKPNLRRANGSAGTHPGFAPPRRPPVPPAPTPTPSAGVKPSASADR